ncbi:MAG: DUF4080 domain-containing protein [Treponema sp.]|nr:DUF4080 domain-containing protein [Candidatus Treponema caballi]
MKQNVLLVAVNSRFNHTNLAVRSICRYVNNALSSDGLPSDRLSFIECTISEPLHDILRKITTAKPGVVIFSVYIWNCSIIYQIAAELRKLLPDCLIGAGGPEVSFQAENVLAEQRAFNFISRGEGEQTTLELVKAYDADPASFRERIQTHPLFDPPSLFPDLAALPFPYTDAELQEEADTRIFYYESSRGCPFSCSYCLSSLDKTVRFMPLERVFADLKRFMDAGVKLVKFVDRTFNLNEKRYIGIWEFIRDNWNGKTRFHFEIAAEFLSDEALAMLPSIPEGAVQFEIGIQSIHKETLKTVGRTADVDKLADRIRRIPKTIHCHVDLIAGLPHESLKEFEQSFDYAVSLAPDMLQLGFLKVLSGTQMEAYADTNGYKMMSVPPYEVLETPDMSWNDLLFLKDVEKLLDAYGNSGAFSYTFRWLLGTSAFTPWKLYSELARRAREQGALDSPHRTVFWFDFLHDFLSAALPASKSVWLELLRFDYIRREKVTDFPSWYVRRYDKDAHHAALLQHADMHSTRLAYAHSAYDVFSVNLETLAAEETPVLFLFGGTDGASVTSRTSVSSACKIIMLTL